MSRGDKDVRDLPHWTEEDVYRWFRERDQPRALKDVLYDHSIDGQCVAGESSRWLEQATESMRRRWDDRDIRKFEKAIRALQDDYERERRRRRSERGRSKGRDSRRERSSSYDSRNDSPRDRRRRVPKTTAEDVWYRLGGNKEIEKMALRTYLYNNKTLPMPTAARDAIFNRLDPDASGFITQEDFFGVFPKNHSFKKSLREAYHETGLSKKKGKRDRSPVQSYTFDDKMQGDALIKYVEYSCGKRYCRYATEFVRDGRTAFDLQNCPNHVFAAVIPDLYESRKVMNAFRDPDKKVVEDVLNDMKRKEKKKGSKPKTKPCPRNAEDVWELMDVRRKRYIKEGNFLKILETYCPWISEEDAISVFQYIEDKYDHGRVYEKDFLDHYFKYDDFEADLEKLVKKTRGKSKRKHKYRGKEVIRKIWKYSDRGDQRVHSRDFKDFLQEKLGKERADAKLVWNFISSESGQERMKMEQFHDWFPRDEEFNPHFESVFRQAVRAKRKSKKKYIDFATLDDEQLKMWLISLDLKHYYRMFRRDHIHAKDLASMSEEELEDIINHRKDARLIVDETQNQEHLRDVFKHDIMMTAARSTRSRKRSDSLDSRKSRDGSKARGRSRRGGRDDRSRSRRGRDRSGDRRQDQSGSRRGGRDRSGDRRGGRDRSGSRRGGRDQSGDRRGGRARSGSRRGGRDRSRDRSRSKRERGRDRSRSKGGRRGRDRSYDDGGRRRNGAESDWSTQGNPGNESSGRDDRRSPHSTRGGRRDRDRSERRRRT